MDDIRLGLAIRALRRRRAWRQRDLAEEAGGSQALISAIERGHLATISLRRLRAVSSALDARIALEMRWRAGDLDRLMDSDHARMGATLTEILNAWGWESTMEVTYAEFGERGSIDVLAFHRDSGCLLVIELKTEIASGEQTLRKLDEKARLAPKIARARFDWRVSAVSRILVVADTATNRRRIDGRAAFFRAALPTRTVALKRWMRRPDGSVSGVFFLSLISPGAGIQRRGGRARVRAPAAAARADPVSTDRRQRAPSGRAGGSIDRATT